MSKHPFACATAVASPSYYFSTSLVANPKHVRFQEASQPLPALPRPVEREGIPLPSRRNPATQKKRPTGVYCQSDGRLSVTLYGQENGCSIPIYNRGSIFDGAISISRPQGVTKVEANLLGYVTVREVGGGGNSKIGILSETLVYWDSSIDSCPSKFPFLAKLPSHYSDELGRRNVLPPSFSDRLTGVPGFKCSVEYFLLVAVTHSRQRDGMWRKSTIINIPLIYQPKTRPAHSSPMPAKVRRHHSKPATQFVSIIEPRTMLFTPIITNLYLPYSQICPMNVSIPFYLKLTGSEYSLLLFSSCMESPASFHPFSTSETILGSPQPLNPLVRAATISKPEIRVTLVRQVAVDAGNPRLCVLNSDTKSKMYKNTVVGDGKLVRASRTADSIIWAGEIIILVDLPCGGFSAANLTVQDAIILSIQSSDSSAHATLINFRQVIPIRLTTNTYECQEAIKVTDIF